MKRKKIKEKKKQNMEEKRKEEGEKKKLTRSNQGLNSNFALARGKT